MDEKFSWFSAFDGAVCEGCSRDFRIDELLETQIVWNKVYANISMLQTKGKESQQLQL